MTLRIYMVMGVSGCGKSTIGEQLAQVLNIPFYDGDDFHPENNIRKMAQGIPLTDQDRYDWLKRIHAQARTCLEKGESAVFACSALKKSYRDILSEEITPHFLWIYLKGECELIEKRLQQRKGHFMPATLLPSQFEILEEPSGALHIHIEHNPETIIQTILAYSMKSSFGIAGMGVMGKSLARNLAGKGVTLSLYNRYVVLTEEGVAETCIQTFPELKQAKGFEDLKLFVESLQTPRKIFLMIKAGTETDLFIESLLPFLEAGDVLIDGGNSYYEDTKRRMEFLRAKQIHFIGTGVSGGEQGALHGPSMMPSGSEEAYALVQPYFDLMAARDQNGKPCCSYIGTEGSGHFVKMVHNGMEYAEMQLIAEVYAYLRYVAQMPVPHIAQLFAEWNTGELNSYLLDITSRLLLKKEGEDWLIDLILDAAGNKGTGNWATIAASELGMPSTMITAALFARYLSTIKETLTQIRDTTYIAELNSPVPAEDITNAYTLARIINHQQGFMLLKSGSDKHQWHLNLSEIARIWTNGCIIRSTLMQQLAEAFQETADVFSVTDIRIRMQSLKSSLRLFSLSSVQHDLSIPCHTAALDYLNTLRANYATANIIQAQRDYFGAHTYQKKNDASGASYHTHWE